MFITAERIALLAPHVYGSTAAALAPIIDEEMPKYGVTTLLRRAHFMGQACWESSYFAKFEENLNYTHATAIAAAWPRLASRAADLLGKPQALANAAYANHNGNRDEASGDGWRYRGRGIFDLTGANNYRDCGHALGVDLIADPTWVATPEGAVKSALWFWNSHGCNALADLDNAEHVTVKINGAARAGLTQRTELTQDAKRIFI